MAERALFIARLDALRAKALRRGCPEDCIGLLGVELCARCGDEMLTGMEHDVRTEECERHT
ncbi:hypothetical protein WHJ98_14615 [Staphylococcus aureus]|uniref:hypothetical protein n=1 Tax=Staphylococcus aureus TaxID=1280 RepID=UPI0039BE77FF